jgi:predicted porin
MNKKLLTLAVGAALGATPMFANAAVSVYGLAHLSIDGIDNGAATNNSITTLSSNSSFIGFKADEDLGGGVKAIFGAEWQVGLDNASTNGVVTTSYNPTLTATASFTDSTGIANRNVFVGLQGGFGTLRLGNYDDVMKKVGRAVDMFYNEQIGESRAATRQSRWDERLSNSVNYDSPAFAGITITGNYGLENTVVDTSKLNAYALGVQYASGPLYAGIAYKSVDISDTTDTNAIRAAASYLFGFGLKIAGFYQTVSDVGGASGIDQDTYGAGVSYTIGKIVPKAQYYNVDASNTAGTNGYALTSVGVDFLWSKTTVVYATYAVMANDTASTSTVIGAGHGNPNDASLGSTPAGEDSSAWSVGMRMAF